MIQNYTSFGSIPENLLEPGAPVVIKAGNLVRDQENGAVYAQLKMQNVSLKVIAGAVLEIYPTGADISVPCELSSLAVPSAAVFGEQMMFPLPVENAESFSVRIAFVSFSDGTVWHSMSSAPWEPASAAQLDEALFLCRQYMAEKPAACGVKVEKKSSGKKIMMAAMGIELMAVILMISSYVVFPFLLNPGRMPSWHSFIYVFQMFFAMAGCHLLLSLPVPIIGLVMSRRKSVKSYTPMAVIFTAVLVLQLVIAVICGLWGNTGTVQALYYVDGSDAISGVLILLSQLENKEFLPFGILSSASQWAFLVKNVVAVLGAWKLSREK